MHQRISRIHRLIEPLRQQIINHEVYASITTIEDLNIFMSYHVYAVWDFMSLLKSLQRELTCTKVPWFPAESPRACYLVNEIVLGEESDINFEGERCSHFEMYLQAMRQIKSDTTGIENFLNALAHTKDFEAAYTVAGTPRHVREFVDFTFSVIESRKSYLQAAIFTFGREDLIPEMFHSLVADLNRHSTSDISIFKYYLDRHIEVDGGQHGALAIEMLWELCQGNATRWEEVEQIILAALRARIGLWDGALNEIARQKATR